MKCNPAEMKIMMTEPPSNPKKNREKVVKIQAYFWIIFSSGTPPSLKHVPRLADGWNDVRKVWIRGSVCVDPSYAYSICPRTSYWGDYHPAWFHKVSFHYTKLHAFIFSIYLSLIHHYLAKVVVDTGDGVTHAVPVWDGFVNPTLISRLDVAGRHITRLLFFLISMKNCRHRNI